MFAAALCSAGMVIHRPFTARGSQHLMSGGPGSAKAWWTMALSCKPMHLDDYCFSSNTDQNLTMVLYWCNNCNNCLVYGNGIQLTHNITRKITYNCTFNMTRNMSFNMTNNMKSNMKSNTICNMPCNMTHRTTC